MQFLPIGQPPEEIDYDYVHASTASVTIKLGLASVLGNCRNEIENTRVIL